MESRYIEIRTTIKVNTVKQIGVGEGRNSVVYLARDPQLNSEIVLKKIPLRAFGDVDEYFREARILYANRHPRVAQVLWAASDTNNVYIAMPYYPGGSLNQVLERNSLPVRQVIAYGQNILTGIHYIHTKGFIHFDIKPSNVLRCSDNGVAVSDFGQSRPVDDLGTAKTPPLYHINIPPELFHYSRATVQCDIYQAGLCLYRMVNGNQWLKAQLPLDGTDNPVRSRLNEAICGG